MPEQNASQAAKLIQGNALVSLYKLLIRTPLLGSFIKIANAYAFHGDARYVKEFAPFQAWYNRIFTKILIALAIAFLAAYCVVASSLKPEEVRVTSLIVGIFPSLLGFGIGVFALIFVLPSSFLLTILKAQNDSKLKPYVLASDMGYPLIVMAAVLFVGVFLHFLPTDQPVFFASTFLLFYGLTMVVELVSMVFTTAVMVLRNKSQSASQNRQN